MKHDVAWKVAEALVEHFRPACHEIEIHGSLRRLKPEVKDIDLLCIPDLPPLPKPKLEFGKPIPKVHKTLLDKMIDEMVQDGSIQLVKSGEFSKTFYLKYAGINAEIYCVLPPATWGVRSVIRTGPAEFSHWIVTRKKQGGALPNGYRVQDGAVWEGEKEVKDLANQIMVGFDSEKDFLNFLGLGWIEPKDRVAKWNR